MIAPAASEIDVTPATLDEARAALGITSQRAIAQNPPGASLAPQQFRPREMWPAAALILFAFLLLETLLAGNTPARGPTPKTL